MLVVDGKLHRQAQRLASRNDRHFVQRIGTGGHGRHERMSSLVIGGIALLFFGEDHRFAFHAHQNLVFGHFEIGHGDHFAILPRRPKRRFVHQVGKISAGKSWRAARDHGEIYIVGDGNLARVHAKDFLAPFDVRPRHHHATIKPARAQKRRIQHVGAVRRSDQNHSLV